MTNAPAAQADTELIAQTIQQYVNGARTGDDATLRSAFHTDAMIHGYVGDELFGGPIQQFYDWHDANGAASDVTCSIVRIDVEGAIATARIELDNWTGHRFTDMFTFLKTDGAWKILSKVFHMHE